MLEAWVSQDRSENCLLFILQVRIKLDRGNLQPAEQLLRVAQAMAKAAPSEQSRDLLPLTLLHLSLLRREQGNTEVMETDQAQSIPPAIRRNWASGWRKSLAGCRSVGTAAAL